MNVNLVLAQLKAHQIDVQSDTTNSEGQRIIIVGCAAPSPPFAGRFVYYTLVLSPGQTSVPFEEREAIRRHLWHLTTDLFGDDAAGLTQLDKEDISDLIAAIPVIRDGESF